MFTNMDTSDCVNMLKNTNVRSLNKSKLVAALKSLGLKSDVTVVEGRKILREFLSKQKTHSHPEETSTMIEAESICFVCDKQIQSETWKYKLLDTASKKRNVPIVDIIKQLVGNDFAVLVGEQDVVCSSCMNLLNLMDALTAQLKTVESTLSKMIYSKYKLDSESVEFQVQFDNTMDVEADSLHICSNCNFQTIYEKEYNMHIRTHVAKKNSQNKKIAKISNPKSLKPKKSKKMIRKKPFNTPKVHMKATKQKRRNIVSQKKKKIVFQCSVCNEMFPSESSIKFHAKTLHGNENIVVSDDSEYEDIQTLESDNEDNVRINNENKPVLNSAEVTKAHSLDFLDDWNDDETDYLETGKNVEKETPHLEKEVIGEETSTMHINDHDDDEKEDDDREEDSAKPTCLFCNATFASFQSVQDHVKMTHRDKDNNLNIGLTALSSVKSPGITSTAENEDKNNVFQSSAKENVSKIKFYKCNMCGVKKVSLRFINKHVQGHKRKIALQCQFCASSFKNLVAFKVHRYRCHKVVSIKRKCNRCKMIFAGSKELNIHNKKVHRQLKHGKRSKTSNVVTTNSYILRKAGKMLEKHTFNKNGNLRSLSIDGSKVTSTKLSPSDNISSSDPTYTRPFSSSSNLELKRYVKKHSKGRDVITEDMLRVKTSSKQSAVATLKCNDCNLTFSTSRTLMKHMNIHKANTCLELGLCFYCEKVFLEKEQVIIHINLKHNFKSKPQCTICGKKYSHPKVVKDHFLKYHFGSKTEHLMKKLSDKEATSNQANDVYSKVFKELQDLTGEGDDIDDTCVDSSLNYSCPLCDFIGSDRSTIGNHLSSHTKNYCNICKHIFSKEECIKHIENHAIEFQNTKCIECEETFHDSLHLQHHQRVDCGEKRYKCSMCEQSYFTEKTMLLHKITRHKKTSKKTFSCLKCKKKFYSEKVFGTHTEFAHRAVLNCKYCDKTLKSINKLVVHEKNHLKQVNNIYKCGMCGKVLKTLLALKKHKMIHNKGILLPCEVCGEHFKCFYSLREHSAKHTSQEKKFFCDVCGKGFYFYDSHYRHRRIHLDPLLFKCKTCGERFQTKQKLLEHKANTCAAIKTIK